MNVLLLLLCFIILYSSWTSSAARNKYNVIDFGAKSNGMIDSSEPFLAAWEAACASRKPSLIYVPPGRFLLGNVNFYGKNCNNGNIRVVIDGTLVAPSDYRVLGNYGEWIKFDRVSGVSIEGGTLDGQGKSLWDCKASGMTCPDGATSLTLSNSKDIKVTRLTSLNSQKFHIIVNGCHNVRLHAMKINASRNSPNTDGIHVKSSSYITIVHSYISTGDDCISIGPGSSNLLIHRISCGPGHGISIGSLGWQLHEHGVRNVTVFRVNFTDTENGVRIKTWARPSHGYVWGVVFRNIKMLDARNPIIIDQNYCPHKINCPNQASGIKIGDIRYKNIYGTSASKVGVKFDCSEKNPCKGIRLDNVKLRYRNKPVEESCINAAGSVSYGSIESNSCLKE